MKKKLAIINCKLIDGTGNKPVEDSVIIIENDRFAEVGTNKDIRIPNDSIIIDAKGKTVMPGIVEGHAHVSGNPRSVHTLRRTLQRGITTVCSVSANITGIELRNAINEGKVRGCARLIAGCTVTPTNGHVVFRTADGPWEVRKAVREMVMAGADFIKTAASGGFWGENENCSVRNYTCEELDALSDEAHAWDLPVAVHAHTQPGINNSINAGIDMIHHGAFIDSDAIYKIKEKGLYYMPTLRVTSDRNIAAWPDRPWMRKEMKESQPINRQGAKLAAQIGANIAVGCDYPGSSYGWAIGDATMWELMELVQCGLTPLQVITAATSTTAKAYRKLDEIGTVEAGKKADLIIVSGDPLNDISALYEKENINLVIKDGSVEYTSDEYKSYYQVSDE